MTELTDDEVFGKPKDQKEMSDAEVFAASANAGPEPIPQPFLDRVRAGQALSRVFNAASKEAGDGAGGVTETGFSDETLSHLIDYGIFHDPAKGRPSPIQFMNETVMMPAAQAWQAITSGISSGIHGAGGAIGQIVEEFGGSQGEGNRAKNEVINAGNWAMIEGGFGRFSRPAATREGGVVDQPVGGLPRPEDFSNAAHILNPYAGESASLKLLHGHGTDFDGFKPSALVPDEIRYDGGGGVFGKHTYLDPTGEWVKGNIGPLGHHGIAKVDANFEKLFVLTPDRVEALEAVVGRDAITQGPKIADKLIEAGYDGIQVRGFDALPNEAKGWNDPDIYESAKKQAAHERIGIDPDILQDQVVSFKPERLTPTGELELPPKDVDNYWEKRSQIIDNLKRMWQEQGIHPAEAVHDAQADAFLKNEITAKQDVVKLDPADEEVLTETGGKPGSLGAAATDPADVPLSVQPASPPGRLAAAFKSAGDNLLDIGRDVQMLTAPMATGTVDSMAIAKDFANSMRRNRWDWSRIDTEIAKRFDPESRARMWTAADEESTSIQLGEPASMREHQGLATLTPEERAVVEQMHARAQNAWVRARDLGMVEGEGLPAYTPRMIINAMGAGSKETALALDGIGGNLRTKTANLLKRKYLEAQDTEAAAKAKYGDQAMLARDIRVLPLATSQLEDAIAGRTLINNIKKYGEQTGTDTISEGAIPAGSETKWFTLDHPAFKTWRPKLEYKPNGDPELEGNMLKTVKDADGKTIFEQVPLYVHGDFEGPLRAVLSQKSGAAYGAMMALKGKTMSLIMNSPMIHNAVEWGRALPAMPGKVATFKVYFEGNRAKNNVPLMHEAIDSGLVPIGHRFFNQDITSVMESPDLAPGRSLTAKMLGAVPGLFDEAAGNAVKTAIDKAGDFWHNTLLWDRVADLQMGLYVNFRADAIAKGIDQQTASRMAAHFANRYAGALPKEAMSDAATKVANMLMFSRSFTMGNLGVIKDMLTGLPKDVLAQIERDAGFRAGAINEAGELSNPAAEAVAYAKSMARRKAMTVVAADMALMYIGNSLLQNVMNVMVGDSTLEKELHGYATRFQAKLQAVREHPLELIQPLKLLGDLSSTSENEPGKGDRVRVGTAANGTAIYMRNPAGKIGEEFTGYMTGPLDMMRRKLGTIARPAWQIMSNDAGFGRKIYDPDADTPAKYLSNLGKIAKHIAGSQLPEGQIGAFSDLIKGEGDAKVNAMQALGPFGGVTFSKGAPGGPAVGEMYANKSRFEFQVQQAMPDIRRQIQRGDIPGAQQAMTGLGMDAGYQKWVIKTTLNPATRIGAKALRDFYRTATPEQRARFENARQAAPQQP